MSKTIYLHSIVLATILALSAPAQKAPSGPSFEVATVKPSAPLDPGKIAQGTMPHIGMSIDNARVDIGMMTLSDLISTAYNVKRYQIVGPDWMTGQRFDILGKIPEGASKDNAPAMLQNLLAERFKLVVHHENKDLPVYELVVGKNGPKLKESPPDPPVPTPGPGESAPSTTTPSFKADGNGTFTVMGGKAGPTKVSMGADGKIHIEAMKMSLSQLADALTNLVGRPVLDKTDLQGTYQISLALSLDDLRAAARSAGVALPPAPGSTGAAPGATPSTEASDPSGSAMFTAVQELGLKLDSTKRPIDTIVVDHLEKMPTDQ
jgi:uncharacterized protein (TIGR03435 family)